jgi:hypothetical protein
MDGTQRSVLREGIVAGVLGAVAVALWFLIVDVARGHPFETPAFLGSALFFGAAPSPPVQPTAGPVIGYTIVHGLAFIAFGIIAASVIKAAEQEPPLVIAVVILFAAFETFFLGIVGVLGQAGREVLPWWEILAGNLFAAIAMLWFFLLRHRALPRLLVGSWSGVLREGLMAGVIGAVIVAIWFLAVDSVQGAPLRTPRLLAQGILGLEHGPTAVLAYSVLHGVAFVVFGVVAAVLLAGAERDPMFVFALVILFISFEVFFFGAVVIGARWVLDEIAAWTIFVGNVLASVAMLTYFFKGHRGLARRMTTAWAEEE